MSEIKTQVKQIRLKPTDAAIVIDEDMQVKVKLGISENDQIPMNVAVTLSVMEHLHDPDFVNHMLHYLSSEACPDEEHVCDDCKEEVHQEPNKSQSAESLHFLNEIFQGEQFVTKDGVFIGTPIVNGEK